MCLAIPGRIKTIDEVSPFARRARVAFGSIVKEVFLDLTPEAKEGDFVLGGYQSG